MNIVRLLYLNLARGYYRWALSQIDPMHPDVGEIVLRERALDVSLREALDASRIQAGGAEWCRLSESNGRPTAYKAVALPTELRRHVEERLPDWPAGAEL